MKIVNVIVTGPSAEKSAFIRSVDGFVFETPERIVNSEGEEACTIEFSRSKIQDDFYLYLTTVPADESFQFIWERLADGLLGFVVVFDAGSQANLSETKDLIKRLRNLTGTPFVVVFNKLENRDDPKVAKLKKELGVPREEQIICADVTSKAGAKQILTGLFRVGIKQIKKMIA